MTNARPARPLARHHGPHPVRRQVVAPVVLVSLLLGCGPSPTGNVEDAAAGSANTAESASRDPANDQSSTDDVAAGAPGIAAARFENIVEATGVRFTYHNGEEAERFTILESLGGGVGWFDFDRDGRVDLIAPGGGEFAGERELTGRPTALFRQYTSDVETTSAVPRWSAVARAARIDHSRYYSHGVAIADCNADGFPDVVVTGYGGLQLFCNQGDGTFVEQAEACGLVSHRWSGSAAWGDVDGDGLLDLFVANYVNWSFDNDPPCRAPGREERDVCSPRIFDGLIDELFINTGDGAFAERGAALGVIEGGKGLGVLAADLDVDGDLDYYVGNDTVRNHLYLNDGDGRLVESGELSGTGYGDGGRPDGSMGVDVGDFNADGVPDICVANYESENFALYRGYGDEFFQHVSRSTGVTAAGTLRVGWGTQFLDLDNDGDEDIVSVNGHVIRHPSNSPLRQRPTVLENDNGRRFREFARPPDSYLDRPHMSRGLAASDFDDDGDLDLAVSNTNEPLAVLENRQQRSRHWIALRLIGVESSRLPIGASVRIETHGGRSLLRLQKGGTSYASTSDPRIHVGLGESGEPVQVTVDWPSGQKQTLAPLPVDREWIVIESDATASPLVVARRAATSPQSRTSLRTTGSQPVLPCVESSTQAAVSSLRAAYRSTEDHQSPRRPSFHQIVIHDAPPHSPEARSTSPSPSKSPAHRAR